MLFVFEEMEDKPNPIIYRIWYEMGKENKALFT